MNSLYLKNFTGSQQEKVLKLQSVLLEEYHKQLDAKDLTKLFRVCKIDVERAGQKNCENLVGSVEIPIGVAGPTSALLTVEGKKVVKLTKVFIPLATTEGALVASVSRGMKALRKAGGVNVFVKKIGMTRAPVFGFANHSQALAFEQWLKVADNFQKLQKICAETSNHLQLRKYQSWVRGRVVYVRFVFDTDQAMGMNMVTIALQHAWKKLLSQYPKITLISLSGNMCADKKDSAANRLLGRGYQAQAEVMLSSEVLQTVLKTTAHDFFKTYYWKNVAGSNLAGANSLNMHAANMVAALFLATGQDMAHVVEGAQADLLVEQQGDGSLYVCISLPNLNLGVVGGGTGLAPFAQARKLILGRDLTAEELAGAVAVAVLAGELSGLAALATQTLACAHQKLGRQAKK